jgi:FtsH-binding integral membrane protein
MAQFDRNFTRAQAGVRDVYGVDEGLRTYMLAVYNYMAAALAITGIVAYAVYMQCITTDSTQAALILKNGTMLTAFGKMLFIGPMKWVLFLAPLAMVFLFAARIQQMSLTGAQVTFWIYAALVGASIASIFVVYTQGSIARVFFITAASFGALSLWGYTTKRDLSGFGSFLFMGLIGIIIASVVNIFLASSMMQFVISVVGVLVFAGLTAYDTQQIKESYYAGDGAAVTGKKAIMGALQLYLDFLNMFLMLLSLFGNRE